ncbi:DUF2059 domain-containing protein [uncultured Brevundimonas sp.]|uniref:DUF2059 domain-containing protein n=1 Tax=uncultured Brevundimonas sp. TaxID=213418 RepID=UPI0030EF52C5|tara:strand:+ start:602 stop:1099 length:498 start_codon:yes stop_codon:yes gene_type:complete
MSFRVLIALVLALGLTTPAMAQDAPDADQRALAQRLIDLSTGSSLEKMIEQQADLAMAAMGDLPTAEAAWVRTNMPRMMRGMVDTMLADMVGAYAEIFSEAELEAQIAFYETPLGPSIANKALQLGVRQQAILGEVLQRYMTEFALKYCAEFDCSGAAAAKTRTR